MIIDSLCTPHGSNWTRFRAGFCKTGRPAGRRYMYCVAKEWIPWDKSYNKHATWLEQRFTRCRYIWACQGATSISSYTKYGIHMSSIATAACWRVVPAQGCRGCPCCVGSQSGNVTVWTTFVNSQNNNQTRLKILYIFFVAACLYVLLTSSTLLPMTYLPWNLQGFMRYHISSLVVYKVSFSSSLLFWNNSMRCLRFLN